MPDKRHHRGPDPEDEKLFAPAAFPALRSATADLCWLLDRGYAIKSAVELVGNRHLLARRQRLAVARCAAAAEAVRRRREHQVEPAALAGQELWLDGYNILIAIEAALGGGVLLQGCDGCLRDMATIYARYRQVEETLPALRLIGEFAAKHAVRRCRWWLDRPVSNSGRFSQTLLETAARSGWDWTVELVFNPDKVLAESAEAIATSDSVVLDRCQHWVNAARWIVNTEIPQARVVDLSVSGS